MKEFKLLEVIQESQKAFWVSLEDIETGEIFSSIWIPKKGCQLDFLEKKAYVDEWVIDGNADLNPVQNYIEVAREYFESAINMIKYGIDVLDEIKINVERE